MSTGARTSAPRERMRAASSRLPRGHVSEIQGKRMLAATVETVVEVGYARLTVAQVIARARVSRKTFYDIFDDSEDCFLAAFDQLIAQARVLVTEAYHAEPSWREGVRAGLARILALMDEETGIARLAVVETLAAGDRVLARRARLMAELADVVDRGRITIPVPRDPPELTAEGVVGGVAAVLHARVLERSENLSQLLGPLMSMIVLPYLGIRAAKSELRDASEDRAVADGHPAVRRRDPLDGLNMRLTYRTVRVLTVIGERPGASNREIAERSGITDQGQISKLLNRLAKLGLAANHGGGQEKGASNAWELTARGAQIERATRPR